MRCCQTLPNTGLIVLLKENNILCKHRSLFRAQKRSKYTRGSRIRVSRQAEPIYFKNSARYAVFSPTCQFAHVSIVVSPIHVHPKVFSPTSFWSVRLRYLVEKPRREHLNCMNVCTYVSSKILLIVIVNISNKCVFFFYLGTLIKQQPQKHRLFSDFGE